MKSILKMVLIIALFVGFFPIQAIAGGSTGFHEIAQVRQRECVPDNGAEITLATPHNNPNSCSSNIVLQLPCNDGSETYKQNLAIILTAFASGMKMEAWVNGCDSEGQAIIKAIKVQP
jgi:hypothetical protein